MKPAPEKQSESGNAAAASGDVPSGSGRVRGQEIRSTAWLGVRLYVGTSPYGREYVVPPESFSETCAWFDEQEAKGWKAW